MKPFNIKSFINGYKPNSWGLPIGLFTGGVNASDVTSQSCMPGPSIEYPDVYIVELYARRYPIQIGHIAQDLPDEINANAESRGELSILSYPETVPESSASIDWPLITISRDVGNEGSVSAFCETKDGSAIAGEDYVYTRREFKWLNGEDGGRTMQIPILDDNIFENNETFSVYCNSLEDDVIFNEPNEVDIIILGPNDADIGHAKVIRTGDIIYVNESIGELTLSIQPSTHETQLIIRYYTVNGTAIPGDADENLGVSADGFESEDYLDTDSTLIWTPNDMSLKEINIEIFNDNDWEDEECFGLILENNGNIDDNVTICILASDQPINCTGDYLEWSEWSECSATFGVGQQSRQQNIGVKDAVGIYHCEAIIETELCQGILSTEPEPKILRNVNKLNLSQNGSAQNLPDKGSIIFWLTSLPVINPNYTIISEFISEVSLVEIEFNISTDIDKLLEFKPASLIFTEDKYVSIHLIYTIFHIIT